MKFNIFKSMQKVCFAFVLVTLSLLASCDNNDNSGNNPPPAPTNNETPPPPSNEISEEDRKILEEVKQKEQAKQDILANPSNYIEPGQWTKYDKGIINNYTQATAIKFTNNSQFYVRNITGNITFFSASEDELGTVPFSATGELAPNETADLEVSSGEITGNAEKANIKVTSVRVSD